MKVKDNCTACTSDFWYDLTDGGYLKPEEILENADDVKKVREAIDVLLDFHDSCVTQIEDFLQ